MLLLWVSNLAMVLYLTQTHKILVYPRSTTIIFFWNRENKKYPYIDKYVDSQQKLFIRIFLYFSHAIWIHEEIIYLKNIDFKKHLKKKTLKNGKGPLKLSYSVKHRSGWSNLGSVWFIYVVFLKKKHLQTSGTYTIPLQ